MIEIYTRNFDLHITVPSPNLAFLCRNLDYKPYSIKFSSFADSLYLFPVIVNAVWWSLQADKNRNQFILTK